MLPQRLATHKSLQPVMIMLFLKYCHSLIGTGYLDQLYISENCFLLLKVWLRL